MFLFTFLAFFFCFVFVFHHEFCGFIIFISFLEEVSNFCNRILINQKHELVVCNCQWNCMNDFISWFFKLTNHMILIFSVAAFWMARSERIQCQKHASSFGGARPLFRSMRMLLYMVIVSQRSAYAHSLCNAGTTKNVLHMLLIQLTLALFWIAASFLRKISLNFRIQD